MTAPTFDSSGKTPAEWHTGRMASWVAYVTGCYVRHLLRHCERSEAIQSPSAERFWIASLRSQ